MSIMETTNKVSETAGLMANAHRLGVSHFNKNMTRLTRDEFDKAMGALADMSLYIELYDIYGKGYRSVKDRVPNA